MYSRLKLTQSQFPKYIAKLLTVNYFIRSTTFCVSLVIFFKFSLDLLLSVPPQTAAEIYFLMNQVFDAQKQPPEAFCKKGCSWKFDKFHRKTPVLESLFDKVAGLNFIKKRLQRRCFPVKFAKIFQGRRGFVKLGHFDKCLSKTQVKKVLQRKILELFLLDTLKITFWMEDSSQGWTQLQVLFSKIKALFSISKKV